MNKNGLPQEALVHLEERHLLEVVLDVKGLGHRLQVVEHQLLHLQADGLEEASRVRVPWQQQRLVRVQVQEPILDANKTSLKPIE